MEDMPNFDEIDFDLFTDDELDTILDIESVRKMAHEILRLAEGTYILNPDGIKNMNELLTKISELFKNQQISIESSAGSKFAPNEGFISIRGSQLVIDKPKEFVKIYALTDGFDIYSDIHEDVHIDFIFGDIAKKIQGGGTSEKS